MKVLFTHEDLSGDVIKLREGPRLGELSIHWITEGATYVNLPHDRVASLHTALGEWLYPVHTPEGPNRSLIEQMIERAVKDQVAAVLPLHLKTVGEYVANYGRGPEAIRPQHNDPEPRDVGHPEDCGLCGRDQDPNGHDCAPPKYEDARPGTTHEFVQGLRRMADAAKRTARVTAPECGKCGAPWSDTHGQPGDPCAPAASAPAPAGPTWDDELWSAPSAETSARTLPVPVCPECGHSWRAHSPHSTAPYCIQRTGGTRDCECTRVRP